MKIPEAGAVVTEIWKKWGRHLFEQRFTLPNGKSDDFFVFETVGNSQPVVMFPLTEKDEVIAIRQFRYGANAVVLELPCGCLKPGQTAEEALLDELLEETGYRPGRIVAFRQQKMWFEPASMRVSYIPFLALDCVYVKEPTPDPTELIEVVTMPYEEWMQSIRDGKVEDDKSIALTLLTQLYLWKK